MIEIKPEKSRKVIKKKNSYKETLNFSIKMHIIHLGEPIANIFSFVF